MWITFSLTFTELNIFMFREKLGKVLKICVVILVQIKRKYSAADGIWNDRKRFSSSVVIDESGFAIMLIPQDHSIDCMKGTA